MGSEIGAGKSQSLDFAKYMEALQHGAGADLQFFWMFSMRDQISEFAQIKKADAIHVFSGNESGDGEILLQIKSAKPLNVPKLFSLEAQHGTLTNLATDESIQLDQRLVGFFIAGALGEQQMHREFEDHEKIMLRGIREFYSCLQDRPKQQRDWCQQNVGSASRSRVEAAIATKNRKEFQEKMEGFRKKTDKNLREAREILEEAKERSGLFSSIEPESIQGIIWDYTNNPYVGFSPEETIKGRLARSHEMLKKIRGTPSYEIIVEERWEEEQIANSVRTAEPMRDFHPSRDFNGGP